MDEEGKLSKNGIPEGDLKQTNNDAPDVLGEDKKSEWKDKISGLLMVGPARIYINRYLDGLKPGDAFAMFLIQMDQYDLLGQMEDDWARERAVEISGQILSALFRATDIIARVAEGIFLVFLTGNLNEQIAIQKAEIICEHMQFSVGTNPPVNVTFHVGAYVVCGRKLSYEDLYRETLSVLNEAKNRTDGTNYCVYADSPESLYLPSVYFGTAQAVTLHTLLKNMDAGVCLLEVGPKICVTYASPGFYQMIRLKENAYHLPVDLDQIGLLPEDLGIYEQMLREKAKEGGAAIHVQRISGDGKHWIWRSVRTVKLDLPESKYPVMLEVSTDITDMMDKERQLKESNERLQVAFDQTPHILWEVDVEKRDFNIYNVNKRSCGRDTVVHDFPEGLIENHIIHPDSAENFQRFGEALLNGSEGGSANFIMKNWKGSRYEWVSMSYRMVCDPYGIPVKAIGIQERLPDVAGTVETLFPRRPLPEILRHYLLARIRADLTMDRMGELWIDGMDRTQWGNEFSFSQIVENRGSRLFLRGEGRAFETYLNRNRLLDQYQKGVRWFARDYRRVDYGGNIRWTRMTVNLQKDVRTGHIYIFSTFMDVDELHQWEKLICGNIDYNPAGGLYQLSTAQELIQKLIEKSIGTVCTLVMIYMAENEEEPSRKGQTPMQDTRECIRVALSLALGTDVIIGDYNADRIIAFFPKSDSRSMLKRRIEDAFAYVRATMSRYPHMESIRLVAGASMERIEDADYETMLMQTGYLCNIWRNSAMDTIVFHEEDEDWEEDELSDEILSGDGLTTPSREVSGVKGTGRQKTAFLCVTAMLTANSLESSMKSVLRTLGRYYRSDRVYILLLSDDRASVSLFYEWSGKGKSSIQQTVLGLKLEKTPVLAKCMKKQMPVTVEKPTANPDAKEKVWHFLTFPLVSKGSIFGFLCVENARRHCDDTGLLRTVVPYILKEPRRFWAKTRAQETTGPDYLSQLPNLRDYERAAYRLNSDNYSAMGALVLDVPDFSSLNSTRGFEYGRSLLAYIVETIVNIFGRDHLYRIWDAEFAVLLPNTIQDVFNARCMRLRTRIQKRYPGQVRMGYTWSEGVFSGKNLVREARSLMKWENSSSAPSDEEIYEGNKLWIDENRAVPIKKYIPYFQPKIDMRDGSLAGAEALARGIDEDGNIVMQDRFIETLEKNGGIRELDFYMLDSVFRQLNEWQEKGYFLPRISVNISRRTLFNPTALASILAIQSRYPDSLAGKVDLEITETAGNIETTTLANVVDRFRTFGIEFELDDFGSRYANIAIFSNIKFSTIKLDRSLINEVPDNEISKMLVENISNICKNFHMLCVAEGVETRSQVDALLDAGCIYAQGYFYSKPVPSWKFEEMYLQCPDAKDEKGGL